MHHPDKMAVRPCPACGKAPLPAVAPFCSDRCRQIDLGRWLTGTYQIPTDETPEDENPDGH